MLTLFKQGGIRNRGLALAAAGALALAASAGSIMADDWPQWRGPTRNGISIETGWTDRFSTPVIAWKAQVGLGFSSFVVAGGKAYTVGHLEEDKDTVFCFDANSGAVVWKYSYPAELGDKYFEGGTTGTPTLADGRLYWLSRWGDAFCFNAADGKIIWSKNVQKETKAHVPDWGYAGAPLVLGDRVILNVGEAGLALDAKTGAILWQSATKSAGYSTPLPMKQGADNLTVMGSGQGYVAVSPQDGKEAWRIKWLTQYGVNASDPIVEGNRMFLSTGYGKGAGMFELGGPEPKELWKSKTLKTQLSGAVLYQGNLYGADGDTTEKAALKCVDFATGTEKWKLPNFGNGGVIIADGKLIALSGSGELMIGPASPEAFRQTTRAQVLGGKCWTAPVLAGGHIYCRNSRGEIAVVDVRKK